MEVKLRTPEEREENARMKRGANVELFAYSDSGAFIKIVGQEGNIRDLSDIKAVMEERSIEGTVYPMRPAIVDSITRGEIKSFGFTVSQKEQTNEKA